MRCLRTIVWNGTAFQSSPFTIVIVQAQGPHVAQVSYILRYMRNNTQEAERNCCWGLHGIIGLIVEGSHGTLLGLWLGDISYIVHLA